MTRQKYQLADEATLNATKELSKKIADLTSGYDNTVIALALAHHAAIFSLFVASKKLSSSMQTPETALEYINFVSRQFIEQLQKPPVKQ